MTQLRARVREDVLTIDDGASAQTILVGDDAWERWLEQASSTVFRFEHGAARFTARREQQRGHGYWYAYRRVGGRLRKAYLGRSNDLTVGRLAEVGARLSQPADPDQAADAWSGFGGARHNLPNQASSFLGRAAELAKLQRALDDARLLTLTGAGGVGKTRLALALATDVLSDGADGVWLVELASLADPALVAQAAVQATGMREESGRPLLATLATGLGVGRVLLVLDNCEHLVDACATLADHLLRACPALRILATSREPLGVPGEVAWRVPPLDLPTADLDATHDDLAHSPAVQLFVERVRASRPNFALTESNAPAVAEVCRRLDGVPLAIELAAARVQVLTPEEIAVRLGDRFRLLIGGGRTAPPRQQTLRAAVDWSFDLLSKAEQRLFERLAVFAGSFTLEAVETVGVGDGIAAADVLGLLARLVDRSLVLAESPGQSEPTRYRLLETLRAYGLERLAERGKAEHARARQAAWMTERAEQAAAAFYGPRQGVWLRWAEREHDNARAALAWALERGEAGVAIRLVAALSWSWLVHQRWSEGLDWTRRALALPNAVPTQARGWALIGALQLALFRGDLASNRPSGDLEAIREWVEELLALGERLNDDEMELAARGHLSLVSEFGVPLDGLPADSEEELLAETRRLGHVWGECRGLESLARHALRAGDLDAASAHLSEAVQLARSSSDAWSVAMALNQLGEVERARGAHAGAEALYEESLALFADLGLGVQPNLVHNLGYVALAIGDRAGATARFIQALTQFRRLGEARGTAECLLGFGAVAAAEGRAADAALLFGAGEAALAALGTHLWTSNQPDNERWRAVARRRAPAALYARATAEGRLLSLEQAVALALSGASGPPAEPSHGRTDPARLTPREQEVARLAARGLTNGQIAAALAIAEKTAANHLHRVLDKLGFHRRAELAAHAAEVGLAPVPKVPTG